jgi:hypothetical protein
MLHALAESQFQRAAMPPADYLLHREEGIDLRLPQPQARQCLSRNVAIPRSAVFKPPAVGSISMKIGLNVGVCLGAHPRSKGRH